MTVPNVTKSSDLIYSYESMRAAYEAGYARCEWENSSGRNVEDPEFFEFMRQKYNDPLLNNFVLVYRVSGDVNDYEINIFAVSHEEACRHGRLMMEDVEYIYFDVRPKTY